MAYGGFKDLARRTASDTILHAKAFNITEKPKYDRYQGGLASMLYKLFDKRSSGGGIKNEIMFYHQLAEYLHKKLFKKI